MGYKNERVSPFYSIPFHLILYKILRTRIYSTIKMLITQLKASLYTHQIIVCQTSSSFVVRMD